MRIGSRILGATLAALAALTPEIAAAHTGQGQVSGFVYGFAHPLGGPDHMLAMLTIGLLAASLGGRALWVLPASFVSAMLIGGLIAINGMPMPFVEIGISLSVVVLGLITAAGWNGPLVATMALAGGFALFHGYAHGAEMPADTSGASYAAGFVFATALLHLGGIGLGLSATLLGNGAKAIRIAGALVAFAGLGLVAMRMAGA